ncbi:hypothetical protein BH09PAT2_BH09PAT2_09650 [soil metagenome]
MNVESRIYPTTTFKTELISKFTDHTRTTPTHAEILAAQGDILSANDMATLNDLTRNNPMINTDVVGVLMDNYDYREVQPVENPLAAPLFATFAAQSLIKIAGVFKNMHYQENTDANAELAITYAALAAAVNYYYHGTPASITKEVLSLHCPPVYSPKALEQARREGARGSHMFSARMMNEGLEKLRKAIQQNIVSEQETFDKSVYKSLNDEVEYHSIEELYNNFGTSDESEISLKIGVILRHAEKRFLNVSELEMLRKAKSLMDIRGIADWYFCQEGQNQLEMLNLLVDEYESGEYPLDFMNGKIV